MNAVLGSDLNAQSHRLAEEIHRTIINIQPLGSKAKPYQVKQIRNLILKYKLAR